uniref:Secreted protein n=1 Tax=Panstrongylus lignarius TaxID=156445 RepID=A0A224XUW8_9HEMI
MRPVLSAKCSLHFFLISLEATQSLKSTTKTTCSVPSVKNMLGLSLYLPISLNLPKDFPKPFSKLDFP